jgi:phosphatidylglycerophosphate synthase
MEALRPPDRLSTPAFLTLGRVPLALAFPFLVSWRPGALTVLAAAALSDVPDAWCARRSGRTSLAGGIVDPIVDKLFVGPVAVTLLATGRLSLLATLLPPAHVNHHGDPGSSWRGTRASPSGRSR